MSSTATPGYPDELKLSTWEKDKKSGFDASADVAGKLKTLQKKHDAVDWKPFADGWTRSARTAAELEAEGARRDKLYAGSVLPLKKEALAVASQARTAEKKADKAMQAALKAIAKAAEAYAGDVDKCAEALKAAYEKAAGALPEEDDEDSRPAALVDLRLLLKQLTLCRKDPDRTMKFAFVDAKDKQPAMLVLHPRLGARALFFKLQAVAGVKTGAFGTAWVDGTSLMLQLDKPLGGLVKKIRPPVRACGFRISKAVLWNEDGTVFEQDDQPEEGHAGGPVGASGEKPGERPHEKPGEDVPPPPLKALYDERMGGLAPRVLEALKARQGDASRIRAVAEFAGEKGKAGNYKAALAALDTLDKLLAGPPAASEALQAWKQRRVEAIAVLKSVAGRIASARHPSSARAILEIQAIIRNLSEEPGTPQRVAEMQAWLANDDTVIDVCELFDDFRPPLQAALVRLAGQSA